MTRNEFLKEINSFGKLIDFCDVNNCAVCEDIIDAEFAGEIIREQILNYTDWDWREVRKYLDAIPEGCSFYIRGYYGDWYDADPVFEDYKADVLEYIDRYNEWDEESSENPS